MQLPFAIRTVEHIPLPGHGADCRRQEQRGGKGEQRSNYQDIHGAKLHGVKLSVAAHRGFKIRRRRVFRIKEINPSKKGSLVAVKTVMKTVM